MKNIMQRAIAQATGPNTSIGLSKEALERQAREREFAQQSRANYLASIEGFNPAQYTQTAAGAIMQDMLAQYQQAHAARTATMNSRGMLGSGAGTAQMQRNFADATGRETAKLAVQQGEMEQRRHGMLGALYGSDREAETGAFDTRVGLTMTREQQKLADKASKRGMWGNIIGGGLTAAGTIAAFSDETLKTDIEEIDGALDRVKGLRGVSWRWNEEGQALTGSDAASRYAGVIAQDVEREIPELVKRDAKSGKRKVDYGGLVGVVVKAIAELDAKVEAKHGK